MSHQAAPPGPPGTIALSARRNDSSTAFFSHWLTFHERRPGRAGNFLRHPRLAAVEQGQRPLHRVAHVARRLRADRGAVLEGLFDQGLQLGVGHQGFQMFFAPRGFFAAAADVNGGRKAGRAHPSPASGRRLAGRSRPDEGLASKARLPERGLVEPRPARRQQGAGALRPQSPLIGALKRRRRRAAGRPCDANALAPVDRRHCVAWRPSAPSPV